MRPKVVSGVRPLNGRLVPGPQMLRPHDIDGPLRAAAAARRQASTATVPPIHPPIATAGRRVNAPGAPPGLRPGAKPGTQQAQSLPSDPNGNGTGINPWWRYQAQGVPGGGHAMVNVGTGNMLLQYDDMSLPHKGIAMAFRRTYNSQSLHNVNGSDFGPPGIYGNGWTNTWDAHMVQQSPGVKGIYDIDGARYDYQNIGTTSNVWVSITPGQHATLVSDGACGVIWTKKNGTSYYFYGTVSTKTCPSVGGTLGGFAGRLHQIVGHNRNTYVTFTYSWDNGDASINGKISAITATTESGMTATLSFADVTGHRLLDHLTYPDNVTTVWYGYDSQGNLSWVSAPANNASGARPIFSYGYQAIGSDSVISWAASPRYNAACSGAGCGTDGALATFTFAGATAASSSLNSIWHYGVVNPTVPDGTTGPIQPGYPTGASWYLGEYYTTGVTTPTFRDTDGHMTNWVVDGLGRPTQTQVCTASVSQGAQCTGTWLTKNQSWDANNNVISSTDPRGNETDYAYDANGNTIAVADPPAATSEGTFRPTRLYDYDSFSNVVAYCDPHETHLAGGDWTSPPSQSDSQCSTLATSVPHFRAVYSYPGIEPNGRMTSMSSPLGYTQHFAYAASQQGGDDYSLPTSVTGDSFTQIDGSTITPTQTFWYDVNGIARCYGNGQATSVISVDALGRTTSVADGDDSSANSASICGKGGGQPGWNTKTTYTYFADGSMQSSQTPAERAGGVSSSTTYDVDGNVITETHHNGCTPGASCTAE